MATRLTHVRSIVGVGLTATLLVGAQLVVGASLARAIPPTTSFNVTTTSDIAANAGACGNTAILTPPTPASLSLREAACLANNNGGTSTINIPAGTYNLSNGHVLVGLHAGQNVTLSGAGAGSTIINGQSLSGVLDFDDSLIGGITGSVSGVTIENGSDNLFGGGGIIAGSGNSTTADSLTLSHDVFNANQANSGTPTETNNPGGAVQFIGGSLTIQSSTFSNNKSFSSPGAGVVYIAEGQASGEQLSISGSTFSGNSMTNTNGSNVTNGGALDVQGPTGVSMSVTGSTFTNNSVVATSGGAVGAAIRQESGDLAVTGSTFTGNSVSGGTATAVGGAIEITTGTATLNDNRIVGNTAGAGSGLHVGTSAGTVNATENWFGCNGGPGATGCDTVVATAPATASVSPRLVLAGSASPSTVTGPNATTTITGSLLTDSLGSAVSAANLGAFTSVPVTFTDPQPSPATVDSSSVGLSAGQASTTYHSSSSSGVGHVVVGLDNASVTAPVTVDTAPAITTNPSAVSVNAGNTATFTAAASGYPAPTVQWQVSTDSGGTFSNLSGATSIPLSFTATAGMNGNEYRAVFTNSTNSATTSAATLSVGTPPTFTSLNTATFATGTAHSFTVTTSGTPTATSIGETGTLPTGLSFVDNGDGTATLSGTPGANAEGTYPVNLTATNGISPDATQVLTIQVNQAPAITTNPSDDTVNPNTTASFTAAASGTPAPTVQWQVSTNGGSSFANVPSATSSTLSFTATRAMDGNEYRAVFTNSVNSATTTAATLHVGTAPEFTSANHTTFSVGNAGSFAITTTGVPNAAITETGGAPSWLTLTDNLDGTGSLSGTPPAGSGGTYTFTLHATNGFSPAAGQSFTLSVDEAPAITSANTTTFTAGTSGLFAVTTTAGFPTATGISESGALPTGVTFVDNGNGTATLSGTPAVGTTGIYPLTISADATGGVLPATDQSFTLTVDGPPTIASGNHTTFGVSSAGTFTVRTTPGVPATTTLSKTGTLPAGVTFVDNGDGTATLSGTPGAGTSGSYPLTITASNGVAPNATQAFTLTVSQVPTVSSAASTTFSVGSARTFTVTTNPGFPIATTVSETGALPSGVTFTDNGNGTATLAGTPAAGTGGTYPMTITATNTAGHTDQSFTLTVDQLPTVSSAGGTTFTVASSGTFSVTTNAGFPTATTVSETGALPSGVTFTDNGNGTATLAGTPAAQTGGTYPLTIRAANPAGHTDQPFTLTVNQPPNITSADSTTFGKNTSATFTVTTAGAVPNAVTLSAPNGDLPPGMSFVDNGDGTATLSGTPTSDGTFDIPITASNGVLPNTVQNFTATVNGAPTISSANNITFAEQTAGSFTVTTIPGTPAATTLGETGSLPTGVTFVDNGNGTATLSGTPAVGQAGTYPLTITAANTAANSTQSFTLTVTAVPTITSANNTTFTVGTSGTFGVTTTAGFPAATTVGETGTLPTGVTFVDNADGTATLAGAPAAGTGGTYPLTIRASNMAGHNDQSFTLTVDEAPSITSTNHATFTAATSGTFTVTTGPEFPVTPTISESGALPSGVSFVDNADGTATLSGTAAAGTGGTYPFTITASNGVSPDTSQSFTLTVNEAPSVTSATTTLFSVGANSSFTITTGGFPAPSLAETGGLPAGVSFVDNGDGTATVSGTPAAGTAATYPLTLTISNSTSTITPSFTLVVSKVAQAITVTSTPPTQPLVGGTYNLSATSDSGLTVAFSIDPSTTNSACSLTGSTVSFAAAGSCVIDFNQTGDGTYAPAPQVQQTLTVASVGTSVALSTTPASTVFGQPATATATITATTGTPAGTVQFAVDGTDLGSPVTVSGGSATSPPLTDSHGDPLAPASHDVTATFAPTDTTTYAGSDNMVALVVSKASTTTSVAVGAQQLTATVTAASPGVGTPTGSVTFSVDGTSVGTATLSGGVATLTHTVASGKTRQVAASYSGDGDFMASSTSTARHDPTIKATLRSAHAKTRFGWYRSTVTVTFHCKTDGAPLTKPCPAPVKRTHNGGAQSVTRTINATDGGAATVTVTPINIDVTAPKVRVMGVKNGASYDGTAPKPKCVATDKLSGVASCVLTLHTSGTLTTYKAVATDKAGNTAKVTGSYTTLGISFPAASFTKGAFNVKAGHTYELVVHATSKPTYYDAAPFPTTPFHRDKTFLSDGHNTWSLGITMADLGSHRYWNVGVKIGGTMHVVKIRVSS